MIRRALVVVLGLALVAVGCGTDEEPVQPDEEADRPFIIATTALLGDVVENVVGSSADVEVIVPVGDDPTTFELTSRQRARLSEAALIVSIGAGFEAAAEEDLDRAVAAGAERFELAVDVEDPLPGREDGTIDPYVWTDPERTADLVLALGNRLGEASAVLATAEVTDAAAAYARTLRETSQDMEATLGDLAIRAVATGDRSFAYFAERFDLEIVGVVDAEGPPRFVTRAVREMDDAGTRVVLASTFEADSVAEVLAGQSEQTLEVQALHLDDLGEPTSAEGTYVGLLDELARQVRAELV